MEILHDEKKMKKVYRIAKQKKWKEKNVKTIQFHQQLKGWKKDFHNMEKRDPWLLRKPPKMNNNKNKQKNKKKHRFKNKDKRWWSSVDLHLHQAQQATTSNDKVNQWQRELDRRRAIDKLKTTTLKSYCGKGIVAEQKTRRSRLMRFHHAKQLDHSVRKQEAARHLKQLKFEKQRQSMAPLDLRGYVHRTKNNREDEKDTIFIKNKNKKLPMGFFTLDSQEEIKKAFNILADGKLTIELPVLMYYLSTMGDPPLEEDELDAIRYEISKFALGSYDEQSEIGSLTIDYEKFVEAMRLMSRKQDDMDTAGKAVFKGDTLY
jgi:hypothetical protein|tara:strand:- start:38 stop:991 length:954 start_codon:yes stop_codon:yes gene_type:complete